MTERIAASFRDPSGHVYLRDGRVFRSICGSAVEEYRYIRGEGILDELIGRGMVVPTEDVDLAEAGLDAIPGVGMAVEHRPVPFVSYPYEWTFVALKAAALHHLDLHIALIGRGITLSDATAFNIQFRGAQPIFIDLLSLRRYREGEYWAGYRQFCDQFLNPLLLRAVLGIPHNAWYRGSPEGISAAELSRMLPLRRKFSPRFFAHVVLQGKLQAGGDIHGKAAAAKRRKLSRTSFLGILHQLRTWISGLSPADTGPTIWRDYADNHSYSDPEHDAKKQFVAAFAEAAKPGMLWDIGCNTGDFSEVALRSGAGTAIGFDMDFGALELAFERSRARNLDFLPLYQDAANPSPDQGWRQRERDGMVGRTKADAVLGLALVHHLAIGRNIPLDEVVDWLVAMAPRGVIEFVPKSDPMIRRMLMLREDVFDDYRYDAFRHRIASQAKIVRETEVSATGRTLIWYDRSDG